MKKFSKGAAVLLAGAMAFSFGPAAPLVAAPQALAAGQAAITAQAEDLIYLDEEGSISFEDSELAYTGEAVVPELSVYYYSDDGEVTVPESAYELTYEKVSYSGGEDEGEGDYVYVLTDEEDLIEVGRYRVTATAKEGSGYTGSVSDTFEIIDAKDLSHGYISQGNYYDYTGKTFVPNLTVYDAKGNEVSASAYELTYEKVSYDKEESSYVYTPVSENVVVAQGSYRVTATAKEGSGYTGSVSDRFEIIDTRDLSNGWIGFDDGSVLPYTGKAVAPSLTVYDWNDNKLPSSAYELTYEKGTYDEEEDDYVYAPIKGSEVVAVGSYRVTASAKAGSGYTGSTGDWEGRFEIVDATDLDYAALETDGNLAYTGSAVKPQVTVTALDDAVVPTSAYQLTYEYYDDDEDEYVSINASNLIEKGEYRVTATAVDGSGYSGSASDTFYIVDATDLDYATVDAGGEYACTGKAITPKVTVKAPGGATVPSSAYTLVYEYYDDDEDEYVSINASNLIEKGEYRVTATAAEGSSYTGSAHAFFTIGDLASTDSQKTSTGTNSGANKGTSATSGKTAAKKVTSVTINAKTVTAKAVKKALGSNASTVTKVTLGKKVRKVSAKAFKGTKVRTLVVKTRKLAKKRVKNSLKGSKVKTVQVKVGSKKANAKYVKKYKKIFTKANAGKKAKVK